MGRLLHAGVAVVLVALTAAAPAAGTERETAPPPGFTDLQFGRLLMEAGRLDDARVFLERARAAGEEEIERRFLLGQVEMRLGRPRHAARHFEAILAVRPELTRVRLELASAYYAAGRDEKARGHFEGALADRPPASVEAAVRGFLDRIDTRRRWTRSFSLALAPESNPLKRTDRDEVRIGGVPFRPDQTARSGTGLAVSAGLSFTPIIADDLRAVAAVSAAAKLYRRSGWNDISGEGELGLARRFDRADLSGGLRLGRRWLGGEVYSHGIGPWLRGRLALSAATSLGLHTDLEALDYEDGPARDGSRLGLRPGLRHALSSRTVLETGLDLETVSARQERHGSRMLGLDLTASHVFVGGVSVATGLSLQRRRYAAPDPLFGATRVDTTLRLSAKLLHRAWRVDGFAPYLGYTFERNDSRLPIHTYRNHTVMLGLSRSF